MFETIGGEFRLSHEGGISLVAWHPSSTASHVSVKSFDGYHYFDFGSSEKAGALLTIHGELEDCWRPRREEFRKESGEKLHGISFLTKVEGQVALDRTHFDMYFLRAPKSGGLSAPVEASATNVSARGDVVFIEYQPEGLPFEILVCLRGEVRLIGGQIVLCGEVEIGFFSNYLYNGATISELFVDPESELKIKSLIALLSEKLDEPEGALLLGAGLNLFAHNFTRDLIHSAIMLLRSGQLRRSAARSMVAGLLKYVYFPDSLYVPERVNDWLRPGAAHHELFSGVHAWKMLREQGQDPEELGWDYLPSYGMIDTTPLLVIFVDEVLGGDISSLSLQERVRFESVVKFVLDTFNPMLQAVEGGKDTKELADYLPRFLDSYAQGLVGDWRDSHNGHCGVPEVAPYNTCVLHRVALNRISQHDYFGLGVLAGRVEALLTRAESNFWVELDFEEANERLSRCADRLGFRIGQPWHHSLKFPCLSIARQNVQVQVANSDVSFLLYYANPSQDELSSILDLLQEPFPKGLCTPFGWAIATSAYAEDVHVERMTRQDYHGDGVVWIWQHLMLLEGLRQQLDSCEGALRGRLLDVISIGERAVELLQRHGILAEELVNWEIMPDGSSHAVPFRQHQPGAYLGTTSCSIQLWSLAGTLLTKSKRFSQGS